MDNSPLVDGQAVISESVARYAIENDRADFLVRKILSGLCRGLSARTAHILIGMGLYNIVQEHRQCFDITTLSTTT